MKVIYDVGAHLGEEIEYYLLKADKVVSIDANPYTIDYLRTTFRQYLNSGRLIPIHSAISGSLGEMTFYVNRKASGYSRTYIVPHEIAHFGDKCSEDAWESVTVPTNRLSNIIRDQGKPYFIKIDIEGEEQVVMADLYANGIRPPYISTELGWRFLECLCYVYLMGYRGFQVVNMNTIQRQFRNWEITSHNGERVRYDFAWGCSGPFGEDLTDHGWMDFQRLMFFVATRDLIFGEDPSNWYDIHARLGT